MITKAEVRALALAAARPRHRRPGLGRRLRQRLGGDRVRAPRRRRDRRSTATPTRSRSTARNAAAHGVPVAGRHGRGARGAGRARPTRTPSSSAAAAPTSTRSSTSAARAPAARWSSRSPSSSAPGPRSSACGAAGSRPRRRCCRPAACGRSPAATGSPPRTRSIVIVGDARAMTGLVVGAGCSRGCPAEELLALIGAVLDEAGARPEPCARWPPSTAARDEPGMVAAARHHGWPLRHPPGDGAARASPCRRPSDVVAAPRRHAERRRGGGAAERRAARCSSPKRRSARATCALRGGAVSIFVATDACKGCGACLATCPERALRPAPGGWLLRGEAAARHPRRPLHGLRRVHGDLPRRRLRRAGRMSHAVHPIEAESYRILRARIDLSHLPPLSRAVTERVIHASADLEYADDAARSTRPRCAPGATRCWPARRSYCDTRMVAARDHAPRGDGPAARSPRRAARAERGHHAHRRRDAPGRRGDRPGRRVGRRQRAHRARSSCSSARRPTPR